ncbi:HAD family hydrolase [Butyrivibrio sp. NC3005]|uniref:HAD family hydrolase n=1 Tax=Butyrivibrio sp. NC3005 TaxID=1280685 RepID=UPI0003F946BB|nr:HAD-IIIA family hydrolase [Butyrivibrio sp. NC3005]
MKGRKYDTVIFDLDGTLLNTLEDLKNSTCYALKKHNMPERSLEEVRMFVGNGVRKLMERAVEAGTNEEKFEQIFKDFKEHYLIHCNDNTKPYDNIMELLDRLKKEGYKLAIVSNKYQKATAELAQMYFKEYISVAIGESEKIRKKPAPDTVIEAMKRLDSPVERCVYVGDSDVDINTAYNSHIPCISCEWGFRDRDFLKKNNANTIITNPLQIIDLLDSGTEIPLIKKAKEAS